MKHSMLHIQVPACFTYHLHVSMPVLAEYDLQLRAGSKKETPALPAFLCALRARGSGAPGEKGKLHTCGGTRWYAPHSTGSPVCFTQVKVTGFSPAHFTQVKISGRETCRGSIRGQRNG